MKNIFNFNSVKEFYDYVSNNGPHPNQDKKEWSNSKNIFTSWVGVESEEELMKRRYSWPEGAEKIRKMPGFENIVKGQTWAVKWSWDNGDFGDIERLYDGRKFLGKKVKVMGGNKVNNVQIHIQTGENSNVWANEMLYKTYTALKIIDEIESMGIRTEIWAGMTVKRLFKDRDNEDITNWRIKLKNAEDSVSLSYLATCLSPWFFRHWVFLWWMIEGPCNNGLGRQIDYDRTNLPPGTIVIQRGQALSEESAIQCIKEQDEKFKKFIYGGRS